MQNITLLVLLQLPRQVLRRQAATVAVKHTP
jgi:hypothetical protein